jgi:dihydroorotate dehydrogenase
MVGMNVGKNKTTEDAATDYTAGIRAFTPLADYLVVNISSPNTPGLRELQRRSQLRDLLLASLEARQEAASTAAGAPPGWRGPPLMVKIAPDVTDEQLKDIVEESVACGVDGIIVSNTTIARPDSLVSANKGETGGLSGAPLFEPSTEVLRKAYVLANGRVPLIGAGGVSSGEQLYAKIRAGASLVQLYTAMAYQGPSIVRRIKRELLELLERDGFENVQQAVGADAAERA